MSGDFPRPMSRLATVYRLLNVEPTYAGMRGVLLEGKFNQVNPVIHETVVAGCQAVVADGEYRNPRPDWVPHVNRTTGIEIAHEARGGAVLLLLAVDDVVYATGYGHGHFLLDDRFKDPRFGLSFAIRVLDPEHIRDLVRRIPGTGGRIDSTHVPGMVPIWAMQVREHAEIVKRLGGRTRPSGLSSEFRMSGVTCVEAGVGIKARFPTEPDALVSDLRVISDVCSRAVPDPDLEFIENVLPVSDPDTRALLEEELDTLLGMDDDLSMFLAPVVPANCLEVLPATQSVGVTIRGTTAWRPALELTAITSRTAQIREGQRVSALREGAVRLKAGGDGSGEQLASASAIRWIELELSIGARRFFLLDGDWHEVGATYIADIDRQLERITSTTASLDLPSWDPSWHERVYNDWVPRIRKGYLNLDCKLVQTNLHRRNGLEICDLLGPNDELIHVKRAERAATLSHLFTQGLNAVHALRHSPEAGERFAANVAELGRDRQVAPDFTPKKLVFAILLSPGKSLTESIFPLSRITLVETTRSIQGMGVEVEVIGVPSG